MHRLALRSASAYAPSCVVALQMRSSHTFVLWDYGAGDSHGCSAVGVLTFPPLRSRKLFRVRWSGSGALYLKGNSTVTVAGEPLADEPCEVMVVERNNVAAVES